MEVIVNGDVPTPQWKVGMLVQNKRHGSIFLLVGAEGVEFKAMLLSPGYSFRGFRAGEVKKIHESLEREYRMYSGSVTIRND